MFPIMNNIFNDCKINNDIYLKFCLDNLQDLNIKINQQQFELKEYDNKICNLKWIKHIDIPKKKIFWCCIFTIQYYNLKENEMIGGSKIFNKYILF